MNYSRPFSIVDKAEEVTLSSILLSAPAKGSSAPITAQLATEYCSQAILPIVGECALERGGKVVGRANAADSKGEARAQLLDVERKAQLFGECLGLACAAVIQDESHQRKYVRCFASARAPSPSRFRVYTPVLYHILWIVSFEIIVYDIGKIKRSPRAAIV